MKNNTLMIDIWPSLIGGSHVISQNTFPITETEFHATVVVDPSHKSKHSLHCIMTLDPNLGTFCKLSHLFSCSKLMSWVSRPYFLPLPTRLQIYIHLC